MSNRGARSGGEAGAHLKPHEKHRAGGPGGLEFVVITVSSSRYHSRMNGSEAGDESGDLAEREIASFGHKVLRRELISDDAEEIRNKAGRFLEGKGDVLVFVGGTGVSKRDVTIEAVRPLLGKELSGFGELLRRTSFARIGAAAMLTRATAGVTNGKIILCIPGSPDAVKVAFRTFGGELPHILFVARS